MINNYSKGFLVLEAIIALALFSLCIFSTITLSFGSRKMFEKAHDKQVLLDYVEPVITDPLAFDSKFIHSNYGNDAIIATFSTSTNFSISNDGSSSRQYSFDSSISFRILESDTFSGFGKDTCSSVLNFTNVQKESIALPISSTNSITDLVVKDNYAYISTNSSIYSDDDLFIFDLNHFQNPKLISSINTGPGINTLTLAGHYIFVADDSSVGQLQIIDIFDRSNPILISQAKVPLDIASSTAPKASTIFYDKGFIYLGTEKGDSSEFTIWNVADPLHPILAGRYEIGNKVEKIFVNGNYAYVAGTGVNQLMIFDISNPTNPILLSTITPSGWQTQNAQAIDIFQGEMAFGRDTGGFNNRTNPEFILYDISPITTQSSFDESGGIYDLVVRPPNFIVLTHRLSGQLRFDDQFGTTSESYDIPGIPVSLSCDWENLFVASNNNPSITLIKSLND